MKIHGDAIIQKSLTYVPKDSTLEELKTKGGYLGQFFGIGSQSHIYVCGFILFIFLIITGIIGIFHPEMGEKAYMACIGLTGSFFGYVFGNKASQEK